MDRLVQIHLVRVGILAGELRGRLGRQVLDALVNLEVVLDEELLAGSVDPLVGVLAEAVHVPEARRNATVAEQPGEHVRGLGREAE